MTNYLEITVKATPLWAEHVSYLLMEKLKCTGTIIEDDGTVKSYIFCTRKPKLDWLKDWEVFTNVVKEEDWGENWKKFWNPVKVGEKIVICPSWQDYTPKRDEVILKLDPGSAFGTGSHPTTRQCIEAIEQSMPKYSGEIIMADVGTGSGILAIAGILLGVSKVIGVDIDSASIPVAVENAQKNGVDSQCNFYTGTSKDVNGKYDIVVSNILAEIVIDTLPDLKNFLKPDSTLILSGIFESKTKMVETVVTQAGLKIGKILNYDQWSTVTASF